MLILAYLPRAAAPVFDSRDQVPDGSLTNPNGEICQGATIRGRHVGNTGGWSTGGGAGTKAPYAFTCVAKGGTPSPGTGPSSGVGGSGTYLYAKANAPRALGNYFTLTYNGSACPNSGD